MNTGAGSRDTVVTEAIVRDVLAQAGRRYDLWRAHDPRQLPGGDGAALRLVVISIAVAMLALALSEWLSRRVATRIAGR
jgi:hypothetical protein